MAAEVDFTQIRARVGAKVVKVRGKRFYVAEGDLLLDDQGLTEYAHRQAVAARQPDAPPPDHSFVERRRRLLAITRAGKVVRWRDGLALTYAVDRSSFGRDRDCDLVSANMGDATRAWQDVCGIRFEHDETLDGLPAADQAARSVFVVVAGEDTGGEFIAVSFFPDDPPDRRMVVIDPSYFAASLEFDPVGVLRHELGHVLGFRHEHIRRAGWMGCQPEDLDETKALTEYDSKSVMHYLCDGIGSPALELTEVDREGAQSVYGPPLGSFELVS